MAKEQFYITFIHEIIFMPFQYVTLTTKIKVGQVLSAGLLMLKNFCGGECELLLTVRTREAATPGVCCPLLLLFFRCRRERGSQHFSRRSSGRTKIKGNYLKI
jgi:hypothetical protein